MGTRMLRFSKSHGSVDLTPDHWCAQPAVDQDSGVHTDKNSGVHMAHLWCVPPTLNQHSGVHNPD
eukprot:3642304-Rhodomonas_salina.2